MFINMSIAFLNGKFVSLKDAKVSILDRGFQYGDGVFETMRSYDGKVFKLQRHLDRILVSLKILNIKIPYAKSKLSSFIYNTLRFNRLKNAYLKLIITRGIASEGMDIPKNTKPTVLIYALPLRKMPDKIYKKGIKINLACISKNQESFTARIKGLNYLDNILARAEAKRGGFDDAIFINTRGYVSEATTSNVFMIKKGTVITPPPTAGILSGITRKSVIEIIKRYFKKRIYEKDLRLANLLSADEVFLTNSILEIVPVVKLGKTVIGRGVPGAFTKFIHMLYRLEAGNV